MPDAFEEHAFLDAARQYDFAKVRQFIEGNSLLINAQPAGRWSALHQAAAAGDKSMVAWLLERGADTKCTTRDGQTPAEVADQSVVKQLEDAAVPAPTISEQHAFLDVAKQQNFAKMKQLIEGNGLLINAQPAGRWSALHQAAAAGDASVVKWLLERGADATCTTRDGQTPSEVAKPSVRSLLVATDIPAASVSAPPVAPSPFSALQAISWQWYHEYPAPTFPGGFKKSDLWDDFNETEHELLESQWATLGAAGKFTMSDLKSVKQFPTFGNTFGPVTAAATAAAVDFGKMTLTCAETQKGVQIRREITSFAAEAIKTKFMDHVTWSHASARGTYVEPAASTCFAGASPWIGGTFKAAAYDDDWGYNGTNDYGQMKPPTAKQLFIALAKSEAFEANPWIQGLFGHGFESKILRKMMDAQWRAFSSERRAEYEKQEACRYEEFNYGRALKMLFREAPARYTLELDYLQLVGAMRDKVDWARKVLDPSIAAKWKAEAGGGEMAERAVAEVSWLAIQPPPRPAAVVGTYGSDELIPPALHADLVASFTRLREWRPRGAPMLPPSQDWHPGSNNQVLDLVHPALYCLERGASRIVSSAEKRPPPTGPQLPEDPWEIFAPSTRPWQAYESLDTKYTLATSKTTQKVMTIDELRVAYEAAAATGESYVCPQDGVSTKWTKISDVAGLQHWLERPAPSKLAFSKPAAFQYSRSGLMWLPAEFELSADGSTCAIHSVINNLHPRIHRRIYSTIADTFAKLAPLLEAVLVEHLKPREHACDPSHSWYQMEERSENEGGEDDDDDWYDNQWSHRTITGPKLLPWAPPTQGPFAAASAAAAAAASASFPAARMAA